MRECLTVPEEAPAYIFALEAVLEERGSLLYRISSDARPPTKGSKFRRDFATILHLLWSKSVRSLLLPLIYGLLALI